MKFFLIMNTRILSNIAIGTHEDCITKCAKTAIQRNRLVSLDLSDPDGVNPSSANGIPFGVSTDEAALGEIINIDLLGCSNTIDIVTEAAVGAGSLLIPGANGTVLPMPLTAGTYTCIGLALSSAPNGEPVEVLSSLPYQQKITG
jgi:hypothetical protein